MDKTILNIIEDYRAEIKDLKEQVQCFASKDMFKRPNMSDHSKLIDENIKLEKTVEALEAHIAGRNKLQTEICGSCKVEKVVLTKENKELKNKIKTLEYEKKRETRRCESIKAAHMHSDGSILISKQELDRLYDLENKHGNTEEVIKSCHNCRKEIDGFCPHKIAGSCGPNPDSEKWEAI